MRFMSAEAVVERLFEACHARSVEQLVAAYARDAYQYEFPARLLAAGHEQIRARAARDLADPPFRMRLVHRTVLGNVVVEHREIDRSQHGGLARSAAIGIYVVDRGLIRTASFLNGAAVADGPRYAFGGVALNGLGCAPRALGGASPFVG